MKGLLGAAQGQDGVVGQERPLDVRMNEVGQALLRLLGVEEGEPGRELGEPRGRRARVRGRDAGQRVGDGRAAGAEGRAQGALFRRSEGAAVIR